MFSAGLVAVLAGFGSGCSTVPLSKLPDDAGVEVTLDSTVRVVVPYRRVKFFVDVTNGTSRPLDLSALSIELRASPRLAPDSVSLRQTWSYAGLPLPELAPGKRLSVPILPEKGVEFPLERLSAGEYRVVALVDGRFESPPYDLQVHRPDLVEGIPARRSTGPTHHRRLPEAIRTRSVQTPTTPGGGGGQRWDR